MWRNLSFSGPSPTISRRESEFSFKYLWKVISVSVCALVTLAAIYVGQTYWRFFENPLAIVVVFGLVIGLRGAQYVSTGKELWIRNHQWKSLSMLIIAAAPSIIWGIRGLMIGTSFLGIHALRLTPYSELDLILMSIMDQVWGTGSSAAQFDLATPVLWVIHPFVNGYFGIVTLVLVGLVVWKRENTIILSMMLFLFICYITLMGYFPKGRHLLLISVMVSILVAAGTELLIQEFNLIPESTIVELVIAASFTGTAMFVMGTTALFAQYSGLNQQVINSTPVLGFIQSFSLSMTPELVAKTVLISLIVGLLVFITVAVLRFRSVRHHMQPTLPDKTALRRTQIAFILIMVVSMGAFTPSFAMAYLTTDGDILSFDRKGSWHQADHLTADYLLGEMTRGSFILTVSDFVFLYRGLSVVDLLHGGLPVFRDYVQSRNETEMRLYLRSLNITKAVFPTESHWAFLYFDRLVKAAPFLQTILNSSFLVKDANFGVWQIYDII